MRKLLIGLLAILSLGISAGSQAFATPVRSSMMNLVEQTATRCDSTGGHCNRLHIVVQEMSDLQGNTWFRAFASDTCTSSAGDVSCAHLQGLVWLNCHRGSVNCIPDGTGQPNGGDTVDGPSVSCNNCTISGTVTPWYHHPNGNMQTYQAQASFLFTTGAVGGGSNWNISAVTLSFPLT